MAAVNNIPRDIQESIRDVLDKRVKVSFRRLVKMEIRGDKTDNRVLAYSPCRVFLLSAKVPSKLETSFHFLDIQAIESKKPNQLTLTVDGKPYTFFSMEATSDDMNHMITHIGISLKQIFPSFPLERILVKIDVQPTDRLKTMNDMIKALEKREVGPCGAFATMYQCMCDYYGLSFREEVAWDVDTIYLSHDSRELRLQDFDHLSGKDLVPIIGALEHNTWFKRINASNVKLTVEACNELIKVMKRNAVIEEVNLSNTGIKIDFVQKFALAIISNSGSQLTSLDLSNNLLEDKAIIHLLGAIKILPCGLTHLDVSRTGISTRCLNKIGEVIAQSPNVIAALSTLKLNDNGFKGDDFPMLYNYLAQPNVISYIDLSFTDCTLDALCDPLLRGCPHLMTLKVSKTVFTHKRNKDVVVPQSWKQMFASSCCLEHVDLSSCKLPVEALKDMLMGLSTNRNIKGLYLDLSSNELGMAGAHVLASCIAAVTCIAGMDLSNNGLDLDLKSLLPELAKNPYLKHLSIGRNFTNVKPKHMPDVLNALTLLLHEETSRLESLSIAESRLKTDTTYVINGLGSSNSLLEIDISGNAIGDIGARMLAKALMINTKLHKVVWDKNNVSAQGFEDVAEALQKNMTLRKMPYPINDASVALRTYPERTETALQKIESFLQRNHSPRRFASDQAYRLQQGLLISSTQQMIDRLVVQVQDTVNALQSLGTKEVYANDVNTAQKVVADANNSRQLFSGLQDIAIKSQGPGNPIEVQLQQVANTLKQAIDKQMKKTEEGMLKCTNNLFPVIMTSPSFQSALKESCQIKSSLPKDFTEGMLEGATTDIFNMTGEMNLAVAAHITDTVTEEVIESLSNSYKSLTHHLNLRKSGHYKEPNTEKDEIKNSSEASPKFPSKRKSRKTRPQSTMDHEHIPSNIIEDVGEQKAAVYQTLSIVTEEEALALSGRAQDRPSLPNMEERSTEGTPIGSTERLDGFDDITTTSPKPLEHITKARPRREKVHRPTRPIVPTGTTEMEEEVNIGMKLSYQAQTSVSSTHASTSISPASANTVQPKVEPSKSKYDDTTSKKPESKGWMTNFMKKSQDKPEKEAKEAKKSSSFGTSFSSIFKKKDDRKKSIGSEAAEKTDATDVSSEGTGVDQEESTKSVESLEIVKEVEGVADQAGDLGKGNKKTEENQLQPEKSDEKISLSPRTPKEKFAFDRVALLPQIKKVETKPPTLALEEDTSLGAEEETTEIEEPDASPPNEEKKDEMGKLPAGLAKMSGLGALGGKNLLQEMKLKQEKRFSQKLPSPGEEQKELLQGKPTSREANNNQVAGGEEQNGKEVKRSAGPVSKVELRKLSAPEQDHGKKDTNDNMPESSPSRVALKSTLSTLPAKVPAPSPRVSFPPKRPVSTVEESDPTQELPACMTTSSPELVLNDTASASASIKKPRPLPPAKPRPAVRPRLKRGDSGPEDSTETAPPSSPPLKSSTELQTPEATASPVSNATPAETSLLEAPSASQMDVGIVYDSATLRMSVKDKIKRLSHANTSNSEAPSHIPLGTKQKTMSLPKNSRLIENSPKGAGSDRDSSLSDSRLCEEVTSDILDEDTSLLQSRPESGVLDKPDDEIMV